MPLCGIDDKIVYFDLDRTPSIEDLMSLCGVRDLLIAEQFLNNTSYMITMFFGKVRITCVFDHESFIFISIIRDVDLLPLRTFIELMFRLSTLIALSNTRFDVWILLALYCGGDRRHWVCCKGVSHLTGWRSFARCETLLSSCTARCPLCYTLER